MGKTIKLPAAAKMMNTTPKSAASRLRALGYTVTCTRCGGSGRHSYNQMDGDKCWGCDGRKVSLAPLTIEILTAAIARIAAGELDAYFATNRARNSIKAKADQFWALYMGTEVGKAHGRVGHIRDCYDELPVDRAMGLMNSALDWVYEAQYGRTTGSLRCGRKAIDLDPVTAVAHIDLAIATVGIVCLAWEQHSAAIQQAA